MLPSRREKTDFIETGKGVGKAVERYFAELIKGYDKAMQGRQITHESRTTTKQRLEQLRDAIVKERSPRKFRLDLLERCHLDMRNGSHSIDAYEIRNVLGGADIGFPGITSWSS